MKTKQEISEAKQMANQLCIRIQELESVASNLSRINGGRYNDAEEALDQAIIQIRSQALPELQAEIKKAEDTLAKMVPPFEIISGAMYLGYAIRDKKIYLKSNGDSWVIGIIDEYANSLKFESVLCSSTSKHNYKFFVDAIKFVESERSKQSDDADVYIKTIQVGCCQSVSVKYLCKLVDDCPKIVEYVKLALGKYTVNVYERK